MKHVKKFDNLNEEYIPNSPIYDDRFDGEEISFKNDKKYEIQVNNQKFFLKSNNVNEACVRALRKYIDQLDSESDSAYFQIKAGLIK